MMSNGDRAPSSGYIGLMQRKAESGFDELFTGVREVIYTDLPDHPNVGDSAIAAGQFRYLSSRAITIRAAYCIGTLRVGALRSHLPVVINGGGNIAGFFGGIDEHRNRMAERLMPNVTLIQAPQSVHFNTTDARSEFARRFASRPGLRMAVRDERSIAALDGLIDRVLLVPDAVHHLGYIDGPVPTARVVALARRDQESRARDTASWRGVDWGPDEPSLARATWLRWKVRRVGGIGAALNPTPSRWERIAHRRLARGVAMLAQGEIIITDRLHAMLLGLQMGRRVIAVDNNNRKLSSYASTWFSQSSPDLRFAHNFDDALRMTRSL